MNPSTPLSLAVSATKDKLEASVHDIWSSIRSLDEIAKKSTEAEEDGTPKSPAEGTVSASLERIENVFKIMFGSCTNGGVQPSSASDPELSQPYQYEKPRTSSFRSSEFVYQKDLGDHVYAQLFRDDVDRASRAVDDLREQDTRQKAGESPRHSKSPSRQFLHPFPVSSPTRRRAGSTSKRGKSDTPPVTSGDIYIAKDSSFDDCISAISAHTLDDMARVHDEKTNTPHDTKGFFSRPVEAVEEISYPLSSRSRRSSSSLVSRDRSLPPVSPTPLKLARGRSSGTHASRATRSSRCTWTTNSTQDSDFAHVWHKQEQKYWEDVVEQDKKTTSPCMTGTAKLKSRRRSRCGSYSTSKDHTVATASSSSYASSYMDKQARDTIHFDEEVVMNIAVAHNSQLSEI